MKDKILGISKYWMYGLMIVCVIGIIIGSVYDYQISEALAVKTDIGKWFASYGLHLANMMPAAGGACVYVGLKAKGEKYKTAAIGMLLIGYFLSVLTSNNAGSVNFRALFGYTAGESSPLLSLAALAFWLVFHAWLPFLLTKVLDDRDPDKLIRVGLVLMFLYYLVFTLKEWLKNAGSRPRYKYLLKQDDPHAEYRNWWEFIPYLAGNNDDYMSWPSGHTATAAVLLELSMISDVCKNRSEKRNLFFFLLAVVYAAVFSYNRIHMTNHFLSDVCFGILITAGLETLIDVFIMRPLEKETDQITE